MYLYICISIYRSIDYIYRSIDVSMCPSHLNRSASGSMSEAIDSPCECEHNNPDSLDARLFFTVVLAVAPAVTMDEASSLSEASVVRPMQMYAYTPNNTYIHACIHTYSYI